MGRVARAFNSMSASLRHTLDQLAERQSLAAVGEFAATLAHEVRNPLTAIRIDLQRLEEKLPDDPAIRAPAVRALQTLTRLDATVTGALRVARSGQATLGRIDLRDSLRAAIHDVLPEIDNRGLQFSDALPAEPAWVMGDRAALYQLFVNLLLNAAQATPEGGRVHLSMSHSMEGVAVRVCDSGPGISACASREGVRALLHHETGRHRAWTGDRASDCHGTRRSCRCRSRSASRSLLVVELPSAPNVTS